MKNLIFVGGPMGVGKTTVCRALQPMLPNCVLLDGDWCWDAHPFVVTDETKTMVLENIAFLLQNFLRCSAYENILFCWVLHEHSISQNLLGRLDGVSFQLHRFSLVCNESMLRTRLEADIRSGTRTKDVIPRSLERLPLYQATNSLLLDTSFLTPHQVAHEMKSRILL